ncbi:MAG: beta-lactamase family protein, partial [Treponema sp.]|nr:beta-lactamase family protein [Treponema sp.]
MKRFLTVILFLLAPMCFAEEELQASRIRMLDDYLNQIAEAYHIPGMAFFLTSPDKTLMERSYGECTDMNQQFYIGSMSKSYTALCVMQLVEKGLVNLDEDISAYLPDFQFEKRVTVLSLLNQTSGFDTHAKLHNVKITDSYGRYEYANVNYDLLAKIV